jgi:hypothetical protein
MGNHSLSNNKHSAGPAKRPVMHGKKRYLALIAVVGMFAAGGAAYAAWATNGSSTTPVAVGSTNISLTAQCLNGNGSNTGTAGSTGTAGEPNVTCGTPTVTASSVTWTSNGAFSNGPAGSVGDELLLADNTSAAAIPATGITGIGITTTGTGDTALVSSLYACVMELTASTGSDYNYIVLYNGLLSGATSIPVDGAVSGTTGYSWAAGTNFGISVNVEADFETACGTSAPNAAEGPGAGSTLAAPPSNFGPLALDTGLPTAAQGESLSFALSYTFA